MAASVALVTGGAGFIGCAISPALLEQFDEVVALDSLHPQVHPTHERPADLPAAVQLVVGDVSDASTWDQLLTDLKPNVVVHLAAETGTAQSLTESTRHTTANVVGTSQMLDALARHSALPEQIVLTSSRAVYGEGAWRDRTSGEIIYPPQRTTLSLTEHQWDFSNADPLPMDSRTVNPHPVSIYGATKLTQEHLLRIWATSYGVQSTILRLQNVYGPGQSLSNPYTGIMTLFCRMARQGMSIPLYEDGNIRRDFVFIDDVAAAIMAALQTRTVLSTPLDIGSGEFQTIGRAAALIAAHYKAPAPHVTGQFREGDVRHAWADTSEASRALDWQPRYSLAQGVVKLADWIEKQPSVPKV